MERPVAVAAVAELAMEMVIVTARTMTYSGAGGMGLVDS